MPTEDTWRASETLSGVTQSRFRYIYIVSRTSFSSRASNYTLVKCWALRFSREAGASSFLKLSLLLRRKKAYALPNADHYKLPLLYTSRNCRVQLYQTSVAKVSYAVTECGGSLSSFALFRHVQYGHYCYKQAV